LAHQAKPTFPCSRGSGQNKCPGSASRHDALFAESRYPSAATCVVCHRVAKAYNRVSGRLALVEGDLLDPVYGPSGNEELARTLDDDKYRVVTDPEEPGRKIHTSDEAPARLSADSSAMVQRQNRSHHLGRKPSS
jgi:hypothetical protein